MGKIGIVTDSTAYLTPDQLAAYGNIKVVPLTVHMEGESIVDGLARAGEFFARLGTVSKVPTTSQPATGEFVAAYNELAGADGEIIAILISAKLSGTVDSARAATKMVGENRVSVIDSKLTSASLADLVMEAARMVDSGHGRQEVVRAIEQRIEQSRLFFIPESLDYLHKGGRIGGAQALIGSLLQIKPVLHFVDGKIEVLDRVRTKKKALLRLVGEIPANPSGWEVTVMHGACPDEAARLAQLIKEQRPGLPCRVAEIGPVLGTHAGPGVLGMALYPVRDPEA